MRTRRNPLGERHRKLKLFVVLWQPGQVSFATQNYELSHRALDLYRAFAGWRIDRLSQSWQQSLANNLRGGSGAPGYMHYSGFASAGRGERFGRANHGRFTCGVCDPFDKNKKIHAQRAAAGIDDGGSGVASFHALNLAIRPGSEPLPRVRLLLIACLPRA